MKGFVTNIKIGLGRGTVRQASGGDLPFLKSDLAAGVEFDESLKGVLVYFEERLFSPDADTPVNLTQRACCVRPI